MLESLRNVELGRCLMLGTFVRGIALVSGLMVAIFRSLVWSSTDRHGIHSLNLEV